MSKVLNQINAFIGIYTEKLTTAKNAGFTHQIDTCEEVLNVLYQLRMSAMVGDREAVIAKEETICPPQFFADVDGTGVAEIGDSDSTFDDELARAFEAGENIRLSFYDEMPADDEIEEYLQFLDEGRI